MPELPYASTPRAIQQRSVTRPEAVHASPWVASVLHALTVDERAAVSLYRTMRNHPARDDDHLGEYLRLTRVDLMVTGRCQLRCSWCWGPEHSSATEGVLRWKQLLLQLALDGVTDVVFSGGEPLLYPGLPELLEFAHDGLGLRVTLSTNGIDHGRLAATLDHVNDVGIPLDGSTAEMNDRMRSRSEHNGAWEKAIEAMARVQEFADAMRRDTVVTVRTVISKKNATDIARIPKVLAARGIDTRRKRFRMKLYRLTPLGPHVGSIDLDDWGIAAPAFEQTVHDVIRENPAVAITAQGFEAFNDKYFKVDPTGEAVGTHLEMGGDPVDVPYGNIFADYPGTMEAFYRHQIAIRPLQAMVETIRLARQGTHR